MASPPFRAALPSGPMIDDSGEVTPAWRGFFQTLYSRTGGSGGVVIRSGGGGAPIGIPGDIAAIEAGLIAEQQARTAGDAAVYNDLVTESAARVQADTAEAQVRLSADQNEAFARQQADALLVPKAQLCTLWAGCDFSSLPTSDPGHGMPWVNAGLLAIGTSSTATNGIELEDGSGRFALEDGSGIWLWGSVPEDLFLEDASGRWVLEDGTGAWFWG